MKKEYREIFKDLYEEFGFALFFEQRYYTDRLRPVREIKGIIENAIIELKISDIIRPDSKHFLLVNFFEMINRPISHPSCPVYMDHEKLRKDMYEDIKLILEKAKSEVTYSNNAKFKKEGLTGQIILNTISKLWNKLNVNKIDIWG